ncbi:unnamed protein product, partial [Rotaria sp. Silwood1]
NDTLQIPFSTTKGLVATAVALCVSKESTTVSDILSHRAGLPSDISPFELALNWIPIIHILEQRKPEWTPGTAHEYHGLTYG